MKSRGKKGKSTNGHIDMKGSPCWHVEGDSAFGKAENGEGRACLDRGKWSFDKRNEVSL